MTTLPSTTGPARLPARMPSIPGQLGAHQPQAPASSSINARDIWRILRANLWVFAIILPLALAIGFGINQYLAKNYPRYVARGTLRLTQPQNFDPLRINGGPMASWNSDTLDIRGRTHAQILTGHGLWSSVITNPYEETRRNTKWIDRFKKKEVQADGSVVEAIDFDAALRDLDASFRAIPIKDSQVIAVSMSAPTPAAAKVLLSDIVNKHIDNNNIQSTNSISRDIEQSTALRKTYADERARALATRARLTGPLQATYSEMGVSSPVIMLTQAEMQELVRQRAEIQSKFEAAQSSVASLQNMINKGDEPPMVTNFAKNDSNVQQLEQTVQALEVAYEVQAKQTGEVAPETRKLKLRLDLTRKQLEDRMATARTDARLLVVQNAQDRVDETQAQVNQIDQQMTSLKGTLDSLTGQMGELGQANDQIRSADDRLTALDTLLNTLKTKSNNSAADSGVVWQEQPQTEDTRDFPKLKFSLAVAGMLGLALCVGIAFLREISDTSVRSPRDIARIGNLNLLGMIPHEDDDPQVANIKLPLVISQAPHSMIAEQFRQVRTRLQHAASLDTTRSILVTSSGPEDGKSTVACNLAAGLALNGRRILLVDANFRRPELHKIFGLSNEAGFGTLLTSGAEVDELAQKTEIPNLSVLTAGPRPGNATELLESQKFTDFLDHCLEDYDHVIFDTGPLLMVSETVAMTPRVDGVVTVVRARSSSRGVLQRLRDTLRQLKGEHIGVVLNGVRSQGGGYYARNIKTYYAYQNGNG